MRPDRPDHPGAFPIALPHRALEVALDREASSIERRSIRSTNAPCETGTSHSFTRQAISVRSFRVVHAAASSSSVSAPRHRA
jgi:hypothetical protein